jgi:hypothetical protein
MTFAERLIVLAMLAQLAWTFVVMMRAGHARFTAARAGKVGREALVSPAGWPEDVLKISNNMNNQFETPTLFYALGLLSLVLKLTTVPFGVLGWIYVATRVAHSLEHGGPNRIRIRFSIFLVGLVCLMLMTAILAVDTLFGRIT